MRGLNALKILQLGGSVKGWWYIQRREKREREKKEKHTKRSSKKICLFFIRYFFPPTADQKSNMEAKKYLKMERDAIKKVHTHRKSAKIHRRSCGEEVLDSEGPRLVDIVDHIPQKGWLTVSGCKKGWKMKAEFHTWVRPRVHQNAPLAAPFCCHWWSGVFSRRFFVFGFWIFWSGGSVEAVLTVICIGRIFSNSFTLLFW